MKDNTFLSVIILGLVIVGGIVLLTLKPSDEPDPATLSPSKDAVHQLHVELGFTTPQPADTTFVCAVALDTPTMIDTTIQLHCTNAKLVTAEGGDPFPKTLIVPKGSDRSSVSLHTGKPAGNTNVTIAAGPSGIDMNNSANWQTSKILVILGASSSHTKP